MAKENKNLRKLNPEKNHNVAGGNIYYAKNSSGGQYYVQIQLEHITENIMSKVMVLLLRCKLESALPDVVMRL